MVADGRPDLDHFRQHDRVVVAAVDRLPGRAEAGVVVLLGEAGHGVIAPVSLQRRAPPELALVAVFPPGQLGEHRGHVAPDQAVAEVIDPQRSGGRRQGIDVEVVECLRAQRRRREGPDHADARERRQQKRRD